eukprot:TRINITY_DN93248_c0_g1_i1.p1 TRINITY_DN93248_c0_g1~~TRINITY_DN93248_c0_g1_i1.p1  ORF type:complete len:493 (+),score=81.65 TRINITY_DN93248_c0_g1_i1:115-1593(+)
MALDIGRGRPAAEAERRPHNHQHHHVHHHHHHGHHAAVHNNRAPGSVHRRRHESKDSVAEKATDEVANPSLAMASGLFMASITMVVPTRAPMVLKLKGGDVSSTARTMGMMSSCAAVVELVLNPLSGTLADRYGRKPFLLLAPALGAVLRFLVAAYPRALRVTFLDRSITGAMLFSFLASLNAAFCDVYAGRQLATAVAQNGAYFALGCALGPLIGARLGGAKSFMGSSVAFATTFWWIARNYTETLDAEHRKQLNFTKYRPLTFVQLFRRGRELVVLSIVMGLQSLGDLMNIYDINYLYMNSAMGYSETGVGNFAAAVGLSQIAGGKVMAETVRALGQKTATRLSSAMWAAAMLLLGSASGGTSLTMALLAVTCGHLRKSAVSNSIRRRGRAAGLNRSDVAAAQASLLAALKVVAPLLYAYTFSWAVTRPAGKKIPGLPYFLVAGLTALAQMLFTCTGCDKEKEADRGRGKSSSEVLPPQAMMGLEQQMPS